MRSPVGLLWAMIVAGFLVRLIGLARESFWNDELFTVALVQNPQLSGVFDRLAADVHPPLHFVLVWLWRHAAGDSEFALRFSSVLIGTAAIPAAYFLGRRMFGQREALLSAALMAFSFQPIYYSQELRSYGMLTVFGALAAAFGYSILREIRRGIEPTRPDCIWFAIVGIGLAYTHYYGLMFAGLLWVTVLAYSLLRGIGRIRTGLIGVALVVAYLPWLPILVRTFGRKTTWTPKPTAQSVLQLFAEYFSYVEWLVGGVLLVFIAAIWLRLRRKDEPVGGRILAREWFLLGCIVVPLTIVVAKSVVGLPMYVPRYLLFALPAAFLLFARAILEFRWRTTGHLVAAMTVFFVAAHAGQIVRQGYFVRPVKAQVREAATFLARETGDLPIYACDWDAENFQYYLVKLGEIDRLHRFSETAQKNPNVEAAFGDERELWFAITNVQYRPAFEAVVLERYEVVEEREWLMASAIRLRRKD